MLVLMSHRMTKYKYFIMYEKITFTNGISDYFYSSDLHKLHFICNTFNYNFYNYKQFNQALTILNK